MVTFGMPFTLASSYASYLNLNNTPGYLASITSQEEQYFFQTAFGNYGVEMYWIAGASYGNGTTNAIHLQHFNIL